MAKWLVAKFPGGKMTVIHVATTHTFLVTTDGSAVSYGGSLIFLPP